MAKEIYRYKGHKTFDELRGRIAFETHARPCLLGVVVTSEYAVNRLKVLPPDVSSIAVQDSSPSQPVKVGLGQVVEERHIVGGILEADKLGAGIRLGGIADDVGPVSLQTL